MEKIRRVSKMVFGKKKKKETAEELKARLAELEDAEEDTDEDRDEDEEDMLPEAPTEPVKKVNKKGELKSPIPKESVGKFNLSEDEMGLAVNALASSEEFKVYRQMVIGQQIAEIIDIYNKSIQGKEAKDEELPAE